MCGRVEAPDVHESASICVFGVLNRSASLKIGAGGRGEFNAHNVSAFAPEARD